MDLYSTEHLGACPVRLWGGMNDIKACHALSSEADARGMLPVICTISINPERTAISISKGGDRLHPTTSIALPLTDE